MALHVVLVHGLGRTPLSMVSLRRDLHAAGYTSTAFGYVAAFQTYEAIA